MKRTFALTCFSILLLASAARAGQSSFGMSWNIGFPMGETKDFVSDTSFRGVCFEWRNFYQRDAAWGLNVGWNVFNSEFSGTQTADNVTFTGKYWQYVNAVPIMVSWSKYFGESFRDRRVFVTLNGGTSWVERRTELSVFESTTDQWHLAVAPEVGYQLPTDWFIGYVAVRYNYAFEAGDSPAEQWFEIKIGLGMD